MFPYTKHHCGMKVDLVFGVRFQQIRGGQQDPTGFWCFSLEYLIPSGHGLPWNQGTLGENSMDRIRCDGFCLGNVLSQLCCIAR